MEQNLKKRMTVPGSGDKEDDYNDEEYDEGDDTPCCHPTCLG